MSEHSAVPVVRAADSEADQRRVAGALAARGIGRGERIVVSAAASPALLAVVLGALRSAVVPVVLDPALPAAERAELVADADPALDLGGDPAQLVGSDDADLAPFPLARPMHYTSGTTGRRKGVWSGVLTDEHARVLDTAGQPIPGLYAAGNTTASVMGRTYPGAGGTIAPAAIFGYLGARHATAR